MKRKIQQHFKSHQKILLLILILLATLLFGFINGSYITVEGYLIQKSDESNDTSVERHKTAANKRSKGDNEMKNNESNLYTTDDKLNSG